MKVTTCPLNFDMLFEELFLRQVFLRLGICLVLKMYPWFTHFIPRRDTDDDGWADRAPLLNTFVRRHLLCRALHREDIMKLCSIVFSMNAPNNFCFVSLMWVTCEERPCISENIHHSFSGKKWNSWSFVHCSSFNKSNICFLLVYIIETFLYIASFFGGMMQRRKVVFRKEMWLFIVCSNLNRIVLGGSVPCHHGVCRWNDVRKHTHVLLKVIRTKCGSLHCF